MSQNGEQQMQPIFFIDNQYVKKGWQKVNPKGKLKQISIKKMEIFMKQVFDKSQAELQMELDPDTNFMEMIEGYKQETQQPDKQTFSLQEAVEILNWAISGGDEDQEEQQEKHQPKKKQVQRTQKLQQKDKQKQKNQKNSRIQQPSKQIKNQPKQSKPVRNRSKISKIIKEPIFKNSQKQNTSQSKPTTVQKNKATEKTLPQAQKSNKIQQQSTLDNKNQKAEQKTVVNETKNKQKSHVQSQVIHNNQHSNKNLTQQKQVHKQNVNVSENQQYKNQSQQIPQRKLTKQNTNLSKKSNPRSQVSHNETHKSNEQSLKKLATDEQQRSVDHNQADEHDQEKNQPEEKQHDYNQENQQEEQMDWGKTLQGNEQQMGNQLYRQINSYPQSRQDKYSRDSNFYQEYHENQDPNEAKPAQTIQYTGKQPLSIKKSLAKLNNQSRAKVLQKSPIPFLNLPKQAPEMKYIKKLKIVIKNKKPKSSYHPQTMGLKQLFKFYCQLNSDSFNSRKHKDPAKGTFQDLQKRSTHLYMHNFMMFCKDFNLIQARLPSNPSYVKAKQQAQQVKQIKVEKDNKIDKIERSNERRSSKGSVPQTIAVDDNLQQKAQKMKKPEQKSKIEYSYQNKRQQLWDRDKLSNYFKKQADYTLNVKYEKFIQIIKTILNGQIKQQMQQIQMQKQQQKVKEKQRKVQSPAKIEKKHEDQVINMSAKISKKSIKQSEKTIQKQKKSIQKHSQDEKQEQNQQKNQQQPHQKQQQDQNQDAICQDNQNQEEPEKENQRQKQQQQQPIQNHQTHQTHPSIQPQILALCRVFKIDSQSNYQQKIKSLKVIYKILDPPQIIRQEGNKKDVKVLNGQFKENIVQDIKNRQLQRQKHNLQIKEKYLGKYSVPEIDSYSSFKAASSQVNNLNSLYGSGPKLIKNKTNAALDGSLNEYALPYTGSMRKKTSKQCAYEVGNVIKGARSQVYEYGPNKQSHGTQLVKQSHNKQNLGGKSRFNLNNSLNNYSVQTIGYKKLNQLQVRPKKPVQESLSTILMNNSRVIQQNGSKTNRSQKVKNKAKDIYSPLLQRIGCHQDDDLLNKYFDQERSCTK